MNNQEVNRYGLSLVQERLEKNGFIVVSLKENRKTYLVVTQANAKQLKIKVKTRRRGTWHSSTTEITPPNMSKALPDYWIFVDIESTPRFWIVPDQWMRNDIREAHEAYLQRHSGHRAINDESDHHSIAADRLGKWIESWGQLKS